MPWVRPGMFADRHAIDRRLRTPPRLPDAQSERRVPAVTRRRNGAAGVAHARREQPPRCRPGTGKPGDGRRFIEASRAYELLMGYLLSRPAAHSAGTRTAHTRSAHAPPRGTGEKRGERHGTSEKQGTTDKRGSTEKRGGALYYRGPIPRRGSGWRSFSITAAAYHGRASSAQWSGSGRRSHDSESWPASSAASPPRTWFASSGPASATSRPAKRRSGCACSPPRRSSGSCGCSARAADPSAAISWSRKA